MGSKNVMERLKAQCDRHRRRTGTWQGNGHRPCPWEPIIIAAGVSRPPETQKIIEAEGVKCIGDRAT